MNDDELRARLRAADPARDLTDPRHLELTEAQMSSTPSPARPNRTRLALAAAAAAVLVLAGVGVVAGLGDDEPTSTATRQTPDPTTPSPTEPAGTGTYTLDAGQAAGRCMAPTVEGMRALDVAVEGVVVSRTDDQIVLDVARTWKAPQAQSRVVLDVQRAESAISEALPVSFEEGERYIIAVSQGNVRLCGWTAPTTPRLAQQYDSAFPGRR